MRVPLLSTLRASCRHDPCVAPSNHLIELATGVACSGTVFANESGQQALPVLLWRTCACFGSPYTSKTSPLPFGGKQGLRRYSIPL